MKRALLALALLSACDFFAPDVGAPLSVRCLDEDGDPGSRTSWLTDVQPVLDEYCFKCHTPTGRSPIGLEVGGLDMSSYTRLRAGGVISGDRIVVPGQPCASILLQKLRPGQPFGARMPLDGPELDDEDLEIIHDWIAEGARAD